MPTTSEIIEIAEASQYLAANAAHRGGLYGGGVDKKLPRLLYIIRKSVERLYGQDPDNTTLAKTGNYLFSLCGRFQLEARALLDIVVDSGDGGSGGAGGGGVVVTPGDGSSEIAFEYRIPITGADFADATNYHDDRIVGQNIGIYWNEVNRYLYPNEYNPTPDGFEITIEGFDATDSHINETFVIYLSNPIVTGSTATATPTGIAYDLTEATAIPALAAASNYSRRTVEIRPNGHAYTWASSFVFSDNLPEQPGAIAENTVQIYEFQYVTSVAKYVCIGQSLNIPI